MTGRDVQAPKGAVAWFEGSGPHPGRWVYDEGERATLRTLGAYVLDVTDGVVPGIIGTVAMPDFMALAGRVDALETQAHRDAEGSSGVSGDSRESPAASSEPSGVEGSTGVNRLTPVEPQRVQGTDAKSYPASRATLAVEATS